MSTALGRPPFLIHGWTSISSFFCSSENRGCFFCRSLSFSLSSPSTLWISLRTQHIHVRSLRPQWNISLCCDCCVFVYACHLQCFKFAGRWCIVGLICGDKHRAAIWWSTGCTTKRVHHVRYSKSVLRWHPTAILPDYLTALYVISSINIILIYTWWQCVDIFSSCYSFILFVLGHFVW